jgi:nicotinate-nucleotide pyrophosphorylase (carboxylating)
LLEKYAVVCGGGKNHRLRLDDLVLIKDNHLEYLKHMDKGKLNNTIGKLKRTHKVEIECSTPEEVEFALSLYPDIIMLDNMENGTMANAIAVVRKSLPQTLIEVSGEMNIDKIKQIANSALDIDFVSVGKITHSAKDIDFSLEFDKI